jgi:hypothetical protein
MNNCIATTTSLNVSIKAQRALAREGIYSKVISLDPSQSLRGCAYGIEFDCREERTVRAILRRERIYPTQYITNGQGNKL